MKYSIGELIEINSNSYSSKEKWEYVNYLDTGSITENKIDEFQFLTIGKDKVPNRAKRKVNNGDIVYSTVRPNQRHFGLLKNLPENTLVSTGFATIRAIETKAYTPFIYWYLVQNSIVDYLHGIGENSTSAYPSIKPSDIEVLKINLPSLPEQKAIAHILGTLDDKIELNRKMNQTLEQMAQALFKSWFVDFDPVIDNALASGNEIHKELKLKADRRKAVLDSGKYKQLPKEIMDLFPASFEYNEELSKWIPEGWEVKTVEENAVIVFSGGTPNTRVESYWNGQLNWFSSGETRNNYVIKTEKSITQKGAESSSTRLAIEGDILIASAGQGHTRGQTSHCSIKTYINQSVVSVRPLPDRKLWLYFDLNRRYDEMRMISDSHSIRGSLTSKLLKGMSVVNPNQELISFFEKITSEKVDKIVRNLKQTESLIRLRDTLLPQLISGKLRVGEVEVR